MLCDFQIFLGYVNSENASMMNISDLSVISMGKNLQDCKVPH